MDDDVARLVREERVIEAAELAAARGDPKAASALFERACAWGRAAEQAAAAGDGARALTLAILAGDSGLAASLLPTVAASPAETEKAHAALERRGESAWDARLLEAAGRPIDAARAWDRAGEVTRGAALLERGGDILGAARALEAACRREPARDDARLALGDLLLRFGKTEAAVRALQKVTPSAPERRRAVTLLVRALDALDLPRAKGDAELELAALGGPEEAPREDARGGAVRARLFGRYEVVREVASSASARVVECVDAVRGERVAVKIFAGFDAPRIGGARGPLRGAGRDALARFEREVKVLARLDHPNIVPLREYVPEGPAIVLAWMSGGTLEPRIAAHDLTPARAVEIACALLAALAEAHRLGVLHRDVKPANVLFDEAGVARLGDFGAAHLGDLSVTATAGVIGTLAYMSPEQREGRPAVPQSDVYGVGALLFEMLTGARWARDAAASRPRPSGAHRDLDARHDAAVLSLLASDPAARPADALAARRALLALPWTDVLEPAAPRATSLAPSDRPSGERAELRPDGTGWDRWMDRAIEHVVLDEPTLARAGAFARAGHPALQAVYRVDRAGGAIWLEPLPARVPDAPLGPSQLAALRDALDALHAAGIPHGAVDAAHVALDDDRGPVLRFVAAPGPLATMDRDRLALARLG